MQESERNTYVMESLHQAAPLLQHMVSGSAYDYDELYQVAAEAALRAYDQAQRTENPRAYLHRAIRNEIMRYAGITIHRAHTLADYYLIESLDVPLTHDSSLSLSDLVAVTSEVSSGDRDFSPLYTLIDALPEIYQEAICMRFGLCGHGVHRPCEIASILGISQKTVHTHFRRALAMLREYTELLELVGSVT